MKLPKFLKIIIGLATPDVAFPFFYLVFVIAMMFGAHSSGRLTTLNRRCSLSCSPFHPRGDFHRVPADGAVAFYAAHMIVNKAAKEDLRVAFAVGLFLLPVVALPVYYVACVWPDQPPKWARRMGCNSAI
jgi:hypothetical protein